MDKPNNTINLEDGRFELAVGPLGVFAWRHGSPWEAFNKNPLLTDNEAIKMLVRRAVNLEATLEGVENFIHATVTGMIWKYNLGELFKDVAHMTILQEQRDTIAHLREVV